MQTHKYDTEAYADLGNNLSYLGFKYIFAALFPFSFPHSIFFASPCQAIGVSALDFKTNLYLYYSRWEPSGNYNPSTLLKSTKLNLQKLTLTADTVLGFLGGALFVFGGSFFDFVLFLVWLGGFFGGEEGGGREECLVLVWFSLLLFL